MKKTTNRYRFFDHYCLRIPLFPFSFYKKLTQSTSINETLLKELWQKKIVKEAIFLASPALSSEIDRFAINEIVDKRKIERIKYSYLKYLSRMSSRCTPFGLFAGCSLGEFTDKTAIHLNLPSNYSRQTSFDMNFLVALAQHLSNEEKIRDKLLFYPNTSIYRSGKNLRYIEYALKNNKREYSIEAVHNSTYLNRILLHAKKGSELRTIADSITSADITFDDALQFVEELVNNQLLISDLEPSMTGEDFLSQIIRILQRIIPEDAIVKDLKKLAFQLEQIDKNFGNSRQHYNTLSQSLKSFGIAFELKNGFQTDMYPSSLSNTLSRKYVLAIKKGMRLLNKMTLQNRDTNLTRFKKAFVRRYEEREIPLSLALDTETGIGYIQNNEVADYTPILDDLGLPKAAEPEKNRSWHKTDDIIHKKLIQSIHSNEFCIYLTDTDFIDFEENWDDLPATISALAEITHFEEEEIIYFDAVGGTSAANLLARFSNGNEMILKHAQQIIAKEEALQKDKIQAEINHLPEARTGNILKRPIFRKYEIPYLAKSILPIDKQIPIKDLVLSVKNDSIVLRSKTHDKEVIPHLTNAHNYRNDSLPIYHFLCDLQTQNQRGSIFFSWGNVAKNHAFLPRVMYRVKELGITIVFSKAKWIVNKKVAVSFLEQDKNVKELLKAIEKWREALRMPQYVQLIESDNALLINLKNYTSIKMLLTTVKNKEKFVLEEFLFDKEGIVKSEKGHFANQFVVSFYKDKE